jgi:hypothetical protein
VTEPVDEPVDLDEVMRQLDLGHRPTTQDVRQMAMELAGWRATHYAGGETLKGIRGKQPPLVVATVEAYRASVESTMARLGLPLGASVTSPKASGVDRG